MSRSQRVLALLLAALSWSVPSVWGASPPKGVPAHEVEAEFIERFTRFIEWPAWSLGAASSPFFVCTWGNNPLSVELERVVTRRRIKTRPVRVLRVDAIDELAPCHVLYLGTTDRAVVQRVGAYAYGKPLLSVGDQPGLAEAGLLINLVVSSDGFVRFEINRDVANASQLRISAKLMRLARLVGRQR